MGSDKALVEFGGRPLIAHAVGILKAAGLPVSIAGARPENRASLESYAPVISDAEPGLGPLGGICAALQSTAAPYRRVSAGRCSAHAALAHRFPGSSCPDHWYFGYVGVGE